MLFDLEPSVIGAVRASPLGELFRPGNLVNQNAGAGNNWAEANHTKAGTNYAESPLLCRGFCIVLRTLHRGTSLGPFVCGGPSFLAVFI
jgi:hypothetical protein